MTYNELATFVYGAKAGETRRLEGDYDIKIFLVTSTLRGLEGCLIKPYTGVRGLSKMIFLYTKGHVVVYDGRGKTDINTNNMTPEVHHENDDVWPRNENLLIVRV